MDSCDEEMDRLKIERRENWRTWVKRIPAIPMKSGWSMVPRPPFGGAMARFGIILPNGTRKSVYLDCRDRLGCVGEPYWEVYPVGDDVGRCLLDEIDQLINLIEAD